MQSAKVKIGSELVFLTATQMAQSIREGEISVVELLEAHLQQIARHNPTLNAIATLDEQRARQRAKEADEALARGEIWGPLHGVPVTIKDSLETGGLLTTSSHKPLANYIPKQDGTIAARLRAAGAIILGKSNCAELAGDMQTNSPIFGRANNPWDLTRTTGGSTGGGAAAVAAGLSPMEIGSDGAGSIRHPAHFCGIFGLFPTKQLVSGAGRVPPFPGDPTAGQRSYGSFGPLARSVEDLKLGLSVIAGEDFRDWKIAPVPLVEPPHKPLNQLKLAWTDDFGGVPISSDTRAAIEGLASKLEKAGCQIERRNPPDFDFEAAWKTYGYIMGVEVSVQPSRPFRILGRLLAHTIASDFVGPRFFKDDVISQWTVRGGELNTRRYFEALTRRDSFVESLERFLDDYDAWLCPVTSTPAFKHRGVATARRGEPLDVDGHKVPYWTANVSYLTIFNLTGSPVVTVPIARSEEGLPLGIQVVGRRWRDMQLLSVAERLTEITGRFAPPPGY